MARRLAAGACVVLASPVAAKVELQRQSIVFPDRASSIQEDWFYGGGAHMSHGDHGDIEHFILNAGAADRPAMLFNHQPMPTDDFEVSYVLSLRMPNMHNDGFEYEGLALWYVHDTTRAVRDINHKNEQNRRVAKPKGEKFGLYGYRGDYNGLGAFLFFDAGSPMMTAIAHGGGNKKIKRDDVEGALDGIGLFDALFGEDGDHDYHDHMGRGRGDPEDEDEEEMGMRGGRGDDEGNGVEIQVKLRVTPTTANVSVVGHGHIDFDFSKVPHPGKGAYLGLTALSHAYRRDPTLKPIGIELKDLKVVSFTDVKERPKMRRPVQGGDFDDEGPSDFEEEL